MAKRTKGEQASASAKQTSSKRQHTGSQEASQSADRPAARQRQQGGGGIRLSDDEKQYIADKVKRYEDAQVACNQLSEQSIKECVSQVMRHMLAANHKEPGRPVKKDAVNATIKKLQGNKIKVFAAVISRAQAEFTQFGFEMVQVPHGATQCYVLRSLLPRDFIKKNVHSPQDKAMDGLKAVCLMFLHLKGGKCSEDELWAFLGKFGLYRSNDVAADRAGSKPHPAFGDLASSAVEALVKQRIMLHETETLAGEASVIYRLGEAAVGPAAELSDVQAKAKIEQIMSAA